jgi:DNA anti-recombination protein RmuC
LLIVNSKLWFQFQSFLFNKCLFANLFFIQMQPQLQEISESQQDQEVAMSVEEQLTEVFGSRFGYLRGLGSGPKPLSRKNSENKASQVAYEQQMQDLRAELQQSKEEAEAREARLRKESEEREERIRKESEEREARMLKESEEREARHRIEQQNMKENIMKEFEEKLQAAMQFVGVCIT